MIKTERKNTTKRGTLKLDNMKYYDYDLAKKIVETISATGELHSVSMGMTEEKFKALGQ